MIELKKYKYHKLSNIFPLMEGENFDGFVEDMRLHGQLEIGVLFEGKILDGRNRYRACQILEIPFDCKELPDGVSALDYVISINLHRRHLTTAQRAAIGLLLLPEEEKRAKERMQKIRVEVGKAVTEIGVQGSQKIDSKSKKKDLESKINKIKEEMGEGKSTEIVGKKVKVSRDTLSKAKKIDKIAKIDKLIADEWEKAKRGETSLDAVYKKAQIIEDLSNIPNVSAPYKHKIRVELESGDKTIKQIKIEIQDKKDNLKREEIAKRDRALEKKKEEMEKLHLKITGLNNKILELENAFKSSIARLKILSEEAVGRLPQFKSDDPAYVLTKMSLHYDTLEVEIFNKQLKEIREKYDKLEKPLRDKLAVLFKERETQREVVVKQKTDTNEMSVWIEKQQELMGSEYNKQELYEENITENKKELKKLQGKYDGG